MTRTVTARAPGRVNLIGEHLDYNGGRCLPIALPLGTTARVREIPGRTVQVVSGDRSWEGSLGDRPEGWAAYVVGVLSALEVGAGVRIELHSDLPIGAGLSSSAALECSVAVAVDELLGLGNDRAALAAACVRAENEFVGVPTGGMDQAISLLAAPGHALLLDFAPGAPSTPSTPSLVPFAPSAAGLSLLVVDTGVTHALATSEYAARRSACERAARDLGLPYLASVSYDDLGRLPEDDVRRLARHVLTEQARVGAFVGAVQLDDWVEAGALMTASHLSLRDDFRVSCPELDTVVSAALAAGALGARMTGGGFGGSAIVLVADDLVPAVTGRVAAAFAANGKDAPTQVRVEASSGAVLVG